jgi:hypothetical protein
MKDLKKIKMLIALPRFECIPGMIKDQFRALQRGETVAVNAEVADRLAADGFVEIVTKEKVEE